MDLKTGQVYGHLVALDALGEGYVIPLHLTLSSIQKQLKATNVQLPSKDDLRRISSAAMRNKRQTVAEDFTQPEHTNSLLGGANDFSYMDADAGHGLEQSTTGTYYPMAVWINCNPNHTIEHKLGFLSSADWSNSGEEDFSETTSPAQSLLGSTSKYLDEELIACDQEQGAMNRPYHDAVDQHPTAVHGELEWP